MKELSKQDIEKAIAKNWKRFKKKEIDDFKAVLLHMRTKIVGDLEHLEGESLNSNQKDAAGDLSGYSHHMADMATDNYDRELNLGLASSEQKILNLIDAALRKIEEKTYGLCERTYKPITKKRLKAMPYAQLSLEAQELEEKEQRQQ